ncbi:hypothetical protein [Sporosarcina sp. FA9]|uniref:hypothetical protein n=1 Tax=Sporosarcina sp. FA9 TaxID=3413030 RepID=UPI003F6552A3
MLLWECKLTDSNELVQLIGKLSKEERVRRELWKELKEDGKTDQEIVELFLNFGL